MATKAAMGDAGDEDESEADFRSRRWRDPVSGQHWYAEDEEL